MSKENPAAELWVAVDDLFTILRNPTFARASGIEIFKKTIIWGNIDHTAFDC